MGCFLTCSGAKSKVLHHTSWGWQVYTGFVIKPKKNRLYVAIQGVKLEISEGKGLIFVNLCYVIRCMVCDHIKVHSFKAILFLVAFFWNVTHSSDNGRFGRSLKPSTAKSRRFSRFSRDLRPTLLNLPNLLNSENGSLPKTEPQSSKE